MKTLMLVGIFGLWPFWFTAAWVISSARTYAGSQHDYWSAAPWIIIVSIGPAVATTLLTLAASWIFHKSEGGPLRKVSLAGLFYVGAFLVLYNLSGTDWLKEFGYKK